MEYAEMIDQMMEETKRKCGSNLAKDVVSFVVEEAVKKKKKKKSKKTKKRVREAD